MATATAASIRDQVLAVVEDLIPTSRSADKFLRLRNEGDGDPVEWCETNPAAALRRIWCREIGTDEQPLISNVNTERVRIRLELRVAYPQTARFGDNALARDNAIAQDWLKINKAVGMYGKANFTSVTDGSYDATPLPAEKYNERGDKIDFLVVSLTFEYSRACS